MEDWIDRSQKAMPAGECAPHVEAGAGGVCLTAKAVAAVAKVAGVAQSGDHAKVIAEAKAATSCGTQHCLLEKVRANVDVEAERARIKPLGPASTRKWLDNSNIDVSLAQWAKAFPGFRPVPFAMMNFAEYDNELRRFNPAAEAAQGMKMFACVLNTDHHPGRGKHWVCVFGDLRRSPWTVEYFNSSGRPPPPQMVEWMVTTRNRLRMGGRHQVDDVVVSRRPHQEGDSECGVYCLFYIWSRLQGVPWETFRKNRVADKDMVKFRERLFVDMRV